MSNYHGKFSGQKVIVVAGKKEFLIHELIVPQIASKHRLFLRRTRSHFWLDQHSDWYEPDTEVDPPRHRIFNTTLSINVLSRSADPRITQLRIGGYDDELNSELTHSYAPPDRSVILAEMRKLLDMLGQKREAWLALMTPRGWQLPREYQA